MKSIRTTFSSSGIKTEVNVKGEIVSLTYDQLLMKQSALQAKLMAYGAMSSERQNQHNEESSSTNIPPQICQWHYVLKEMVILV